MAISQQRFCDTLRHFASGVTIVTAYAQGRIHGMTASAVTSVSAEPPLIAAVINQRCKINLILEIPNAGFAVNILRQEQSELSDRFALIHDEDRFLHGDWTTAKTGAPILADALAWLDCTLAGRYHAGTHTIYLGTVEASYASRHDVKPLIYWNRDYQRLVTP